MIPSNSQFERAKMLCAILRGIGHDVSFKTKGSFEKQQATITVIVDSKLYRFSDPDWDVVNKQLKTLVNVKVAS